MTACGLGNDMQDLAAAWITQVYLPMHFHSTVFSLMFRYTNIIHRAIIFW